jgi:hypothetical protein
MMKRSLLLILLLSVTVSVLYPQVTPPSTRNRPSSFAGMGGNAFTAISDPDKPVTYNNPVIPGFWSEYFCHNHQVS